MRHVRCKPCGRNRKKRTTTKYGICQKCLATACEPGCMVDVDIPNPYWNDRSDRPTIKQRWCKFCVAAKELSS